MDIKFSRELWNFERESIVFHATLGKTSIRCVVTDGFLRAPLAGSAPLTEENGLELFRTRRSEIESLIRDRIWKNAFENSVVDSSPEVVLRS
jgi:hypothetical protein